MRQTICFRVISSLLTTTMRSHTYYDSMGAARIMAQIIDGKALAKEIKDELKTKIHSFVSLGYRAPSLRCIIVGDDPASHTYVRNKIQAAIDIGIDATTITYDATLSEDDLITAINSLNTDKNVDGILVQLPLPGTMDERKVCNVVSPEKDVDGFHINNVGQLCLDMPTIVPATALAVIEILKRYKIETFGRNAVVVGRSKNVGMPIAMMLHSDKNHSSGLGMDATVTICHRYTPPEKLEFFCRNADIIITATGVPKLIKASMVKPGATVIDVGITRITDEQGKTKLVGDVDYDEVSKVAGAITPVPGGVGPMTVAMLMHNTFEAARRLRQKESNVQIIADNIGLTRSANTYLRDFYIFDLLQNRFLIVCGCSLWHGTSLFVSGRYPTMKYNNICMTVYLNKYETS